MITPKFCPFPKCTEQLQGKTDWCLQHVNSQCVYPPCTTHVRFNSNFCEKHDDNVAFIRWVVADMQQKAAEQMRGQRIANSVLRNGGNLR